MKMIFDRNKFFSIADNIIKWCIFSVIFAAPFSKSISEIAIVLSIFLWILCKILKRNRTLHNNDLTVPIFILFITIIPSFLNTQYFALSFKAIFSKVLKYIFFYFVIVETINTRKRLQELFKVALCSFIIITIDGFFQYYFGGLDFLHFPRYPAFKIRFINDQAGFFRGFPTACFPYPNDFATWISLAVFPLVYYVFFGFRLNDKINVTYLSSLWQSKLQYAYKYLLILLSMAMFYLLFLTKARAAWIAVGVSGIYLFLSRRKIFIILLVFIFALAPFIMNMEMSNYLLGFSSIADRMDMLGTAWKIFSEHPVIGNGLNTFFVNFMHYRDDIWKGKKGSYAHNCYIQMAADVGILGLLGFIYFIISYFIVVYKKLKIIKDKLFNSVLAGLSMGILSFIIIGFFDTNFYSLNLVTLFWAAIGISMAIVNISKRENA